MQSLFPVQILMIGQRNTAQGTAQGRKAATMETWACWVKGPRLASLKANICRTFKVLLDSCAGLLNSNWLELFKHVTLRYFRPQSYKQSGDSEKDNIWNKGRNIVCNVNEVPSYKY